ncbi:Uu.00g127880.m01.CDS01 [Anthostomella pinea]|uniref:Uu.00g127880.m01.CDS01 n=1 Tax=Anthostomella pinea TaxID=933095 RepID=A0AAI8VJB4_9PEZI|nr:Uu.00g127880.m01.CDS01 [Anthostomella pinea]
MFENVSENLVKLLEQNKQPMTWAHIPPQHMPEVCKVLRTWQREPEDWYSTKRIRKLVSKDNRTQSSNQQSIFGKLDQRFPECQEDHQLFKIFSVILPTPEDLKKNEPELLELLKDYRQKKDGSKEAISHYLDENWKPNVTLVDVDWETKREDTKRTPDMGFDPTDVAATLSDQFKSMPLPSPDGRSKKCIMDYIGYFFEFTTLSVASLKKQIMIEIGLGEMADYMERIRYDAFETARGSSATNSAEASRWPRKYHVIHMSNVPDYVGGPLTSFLYGAPLLESGSGTGLLSCVLRNPPEWKSLDQFLSEYLLMYDRELIHTHFGVRLSKETPEMNLATTGPGLYPLIPYYLWEKSPVERSGLEKLMSRPAFFKWMYAHFLKICLPHLRPFTSFTMVYAPLNLTVFLRLISHVADLGYPAHWLSALIGSLCEGEITTTARAPRNFVLDKAQVDKIHPSRTMSVKPWAAEFSTLVTLWRELLPFGLLYGGLPAYESVTEYSIKFPEVHGFGLHVTHFMPMFWNQNAFGRPAQGPEGSRSLLLDDEEGDTSDNAKKIRQEAVRVMTTFDWKMDTRTITFWLRDDVMEQMIDEEWEVYIWRTDAWCSLTKGLVLQHANVERRPVIRP